MKKVQNTCCNSSRKCNRYTFKHEDFLCNKCLDHTAGWCFHCLVATNQCIKFPEDKKLYVCDKCSELAKWWIDQGYDYDKIQSL